MKYTLKKLCADGKGQVAYIQVMDDLENDLGEVCVAYSDNEDSFKKAIIAKVAKLETKQAVKANIKNKIETILKTL